MPRYDRSLPPRRPAPSGLSTDALWRLWGWLRPRLEAAARAGWTRAVHFFESGEARATANTVLERTREVIRWAWKNDTVPAGTVGATIRRHEERMMQAEQRRVQREQRRLDQEAKRKEREKRYSEKSSIYLG